MDLSGALLEQNRLLGELARTADPAAPVPTCPDWTVRQLVTHVGRGDRWAAAIVRERADGYLDIRTVADGRPPTDPDRAVDWLTDGARLLLDAVDETGEDTGLWTFTGPQPAWWWVRRRVHESVVHRADLAIAVGEPYAVDADLAADGVSEWLSLLSARTARPGAEALLDDGSTLHLHATDDGLAEPGEWTVRDSGATWEYGHEKSTVAVRGAAADLLLGLMRRIPADDGRLQVLGEPEVFTTWLARTAF